MSNHSLPRFRAAATLLLATILAASCAAIESMAEEPYDIEWIRQFGTFRHDAAFDVTADDIGNIYVAGHTRGSLGGPNPNNDSSDAFLAKFDSSGGRLWMKQSSISGVDAALGVSFDALGSVYITGQTGPALARGRHFLTKYTDVGEFDWRTETLGSIFPPTSSSAVSADGLGNIFVSGFADPESHVHRAYLAKYDEAGTLLWSLEHDPTAISVAGDGVAADGLGNVYLTGFTERESGNRNAYLAKYGSAGELLWDHVDETSTNDFSVGISVGGMGDVYITGMSDADGANADAFVAKYDPEGQFLWRQEFGTDEFDTGQSIAADTFGNVYIAGATEGSLAGPNAGNHDAFVAKYSAVGDLLWTFQFGTSSYDDASGISADGLGNIYVAGQTEGTLGDRNMGLSDAFLVKLTPPLVPLLPGDYNNNGQVEQADLNLVLLNWGTALMDATAAGWLNDPPTGTIDQEELNKVLLGWGNSAAERVGAAGVPEPSGMVLALLALTVALMTLGRSTSSFGKIRMWRARPG